MLVFLWGFFVLSRPHLNICGVPWFSVGSVVQVEDLCWSNLSHRLAFVLRASPSSRVGFICLAVNQKASQWVHNETMTGNSFLTPSVNNRHEKPHGKKLTLHRAGGWMDPGFKTSLVGFHCPQVTGFSGPAQQLLERVSYLYRFISFFFSGSW